MLDSCNLPISSVIKVSALVCNSWHYTGNVYSKELNTGSLRTMISCLFVFLVNIIPSNANYRTSISILYTNNKHSEVHVGGEIVAIKYLHSRSVYV